MLYRFYASETQRVREKQLAMTKTTGRKQSTKTDKTAAQSKAAGTISGTTSRRRRKGTSTAMSEPSPLGETPPISYENEEKEDIENVETVPKKKTTRRGTTGRAKKKTAKCTDSDKPVVSEDVTEDVTEEKVDTEPKPVNEGDEQTLPKDKNSDKPIQDNDTHNQNTDTPK